MELRWTANLAYWELGLEARARGGVRAGCCRLEVRLAVGELRRAHDGYVVMHGEGGRKQQKLEDTDQEANRLLYADRAPEFPVEETAAGARGPREPEHRLDPVAEPAASVADDV
jgi:hypothetical protein